MSAEQAPVPEHFASFFEAREYIKAKTGRAYKGTDPGLMEAAEKLGIASAVREILDRYDEVYRAAQDRLHELADSRPPDEAPPLEFPPEWRTTKPGTDSIPGYPISDVWNGYEAPKYLVKRILAPGELTVLFGMSQHFKSVVAIDLALSVALGLKYQGLNTRKAGVLYVAGEGHAGIKKRARAWMLDRGMNATSEQPAMFVTKTAADLMGRQEQLRATVAEAAKVTGLEIELVVIDTLAANFGDGDENHASEMQLAINSARDAAPKAAVLLVHHVGNGQNERERGSYALQASADCRLQSSYDVSTRTIELKWLKLKDDEMPEPMTFTWRSVPLEWTDEDGEEMASVVMDKLDLNGIPEPKMKPNKSGLGKNQEIAIKTLRYLFGVARKNLKERGEDPQKACILTEGWRWKLEKKGINRQRYHELVRDLQERHILRFDGPHVFFFNPENASEMASETGQEPDAETDRKTPVRILLRNTPDASKPSVRDNHYVSDADTIPTDSTAALADPLAGLAPSGKGPSHEAEPKFYPPVPDDRDRLDIEAEQLGMARIAFETDEELQRRINQRRELDRL